MNKNDKIEEMVSSWIDDSELQTIIEYAATKLTEYYESLSADKFDDCYEEYKDEN